MVGAGRYFLMIKVLRRSLAIGLLLGSFLALGSVFNQSPVYAQGTSSCQKGSFFGLKPWYAYLPTNTDCSVNLQLVTPKGKTTEAQTSNLNALWLIALVVFEDLLRIAGVAAVGFIIYGGIRYTTSQGEPEHTKAAQSTIINALIGLAITIIGATVVAFIGNQLGGT